MPSPPCAPLFSKGLPERRSIRSSNPTLEARADAALVAYADEQTERLHDYLGVEQIAAIRSEMVAKVDEIREQLEELQRQVSVPADDLGLDPYVPPAPNLGGLPPGYPEPLLDPAVDWAEQTERLRSRKKY